MRLRQTESTARALLRHDVPRERFVYNLRSERLRNPKTGRQLELAIYCPARNFATEVDGIRHGLFVPDMQKDFNHFVEQQEGYAQDQNLQGQRDHRLQRQDF